MRRCVIVFVALLAALSLAGCKAPLDLPESFVKLEDSRGYGFRAVTGDDARLWVREFSEPTEADVSFWADNLRRDFVEQRGFELVGEGDVDNAAGDTGPDA